MFLTLAAFGLGLAATATAQGKIGPIQPPKGQLIKDIPMLGMGSWALFNRTQAIDAITSGIEKGFRHFDTAAIYRNEDHVGAGIAEGLKRSGLQREDVWVTTKLWNNRHGSQVEQGLKESLQKLNLTYVDLYLMHFPVDQTRPAPFRFDPVETWKQMEKLVRPGGPVRFIGVSNFSPKQMDELLAAATIKPKVHQFELHPYLQQTDFVEFHHRNKIPVVGYAPLANTSPYYGFANMENPSRPPLLIHHPILREIAKSKQCSAAQIALVWNMRRNVAVIPKAANPKHQQENIEAFDKCKLTDEDVKKIEGISVKYTGRFNNPCKQMAMPCFEGLANMSEGR